MRGLNVSLFTIINSIISIKMLLTSDSIIELLKCLLPKNNHKILPLVSIISIISLISFSVTFIPNSFIISVNSSLDISPLPSRSKRLNAF